MKKFIIYLIAATFSIFSAYASEKNVYDLRCEGMTSPLGIDNCSPHFSWKTKCIQETYRIQMASSCNALLAGEADLWDTGTVTSRESVMVPYSGKALAPRQLCWWRVSVNSEDWSEPQRFSIGIIGDERMNGDFIGFLGGPSLHSPIVYSEFKCNDAGNPALLYVNSLGYHEAYVNGERVSETVLAPAVSQLDKRSLIVTYDITRLLKKGKNDIAIWLGQGWYNKEGYNAEYDGALVRACIDISVKGGWKTIHSTDRNWKGVESGYSNNTVWVSGQFGGEVIETGKVPPRLTSDCLDTMSPANVDVVNVSIPYTTPQMCPPNTVKETVTAVCVEPAGNGRWIADMGKVMNAQSEIRIDGQNEGDHITFYYCDATNTEEGYNDWGHDEMICCGIEGKDIFRSKFNHHVFRYIIIDGADERPRVENIRAHRFGNCTTRSGSFHSSDPDLDRIHDMIAYTMDNLVFSGYMVDCASIERLGYGGDGNASCLSLQTIFDAGPIYMNWLQAWMDTMGEDGHLRHTAPSPVSAGGGPYWCTFIVQAPWRVYMASGDTRLIERCYGHMKKWIDYVDLHSPDGLLKRWPDDERRVWYLGDWLAPKGTDVSLQESVDLINNCALSQTYGYLVKIAELLGREADLREFNERKMRTDQLIHNTFYHPEKQIYGTGSQLDMIYPMLVGAVPEDIAEIVKAKLHEITETIHDGHIGVGLVGVPVLAEWATREREADFVYGMLKKRSYPGYLYMIDNGATATWEDWDRPRSYLHNCFNGIGSWFYQSLGGIIQEDAAFRHVRIEPQFPEGLEWVRVCQDTPYGTICVAWKKNGQDKADVRIDIPAGITARIDGKTLGFGHHNLTITTAD